jgi:NTE family protein
MVALVSSGGGAKGAHSVGMWQSILERRPELYNSKLVIGTSAGALSSALLGLSCATGDRTHFYDLIDLYKTVEQGDIMTPRDLLAAQLLGTEGLLLSSILQGRASLYDFNPLLKLIHKYMSDHWNKIIESDVEVGFCVTNLRTARTELISSKSHPDPKILESALLASASQPVLMGPVNINGDDYVDGGLIDFLPVKYALEHDHVVCVSTQGLSPAIGTNKYPTVLGQLARSLQVMTDNAYQNNRYTAEALSCGLNQKIEWFEPTEPIVGDALVFEQPKMTNWLLTGFKEAESVQL